MSFFYEDQAYPGDDPEEVARQMGLDPYSAMLQQMGQGTIDPNELAAMVGQQYNPYQGYPTKQVSDQVWDTYGPTPDYLIQQQAAMFNPQQDEFSQDAFFAADPMLRGPLAQALTQNDGDVIGAYDYLQSPEMQDELRQQIGRTEWDQLEGQGDLRMIGAITGEEKDDAALQHYMSGLESVMAGGAPTAQRNMQMYDQVAQRQGGRPYPGAGQSDMGFGGPGFGGDELAQLAGEGDGIDYDASKAGTGYQGVQDAGESDIGDSDVVMRGDDGNQYAHINGRRYLIPETANAFSVDANPYYMENLQDVLRERDERLGKFDEDDGDLGESSRTRGGTGSIYNDLGVAAATSRPGRQLGRAAPGFRESAGPLGGFSRMASRASSGGSGAGFRAAPGPIGGFARMADRRGSAPRGATASRTDPIAGVLRALGF